MGFVYSNYLKVMFFPGSILDKDRKFNQMDCLTVQTFDYNFERTCNSNDLPFGATINPVVECTLKFMSESKVKGIIGNTLSRNAEEYTFLFNASFDQDRNVDNFENAIVVRGYVVDVEQTFSARESRNENQPMELKVRILAMNIMYVGSQTNKTLYFSHE